MFMKKDKSTAVDFEEQVVWTSFAGFLQQLAKSNSYGR
jgi:hypothetical protein